MRVNRSTVANQSHGFTLIELITVVAIISILASLILAALTRAKSRVRSTQCQHNLRQQGVILTSFVRDHSEYPLYATEKRVAGNNSTWASTLFPGSVKDLTNNRGIFECPSARRPDALERDGGWVAYGYNQNGLTGSSFDEPLGIGGKGGAHWHDRNPVAESDVLFPARMIAIGDGMAGWQGFISDGLVACGRKPLERPSTVSTSRAQVRHNGKANYVFCDGHVEAISLERLFQSKDPADLQLWNRDGKPHSERL